MRTPRVILSDSSHMCNVPVRTVPIPSKYPLSAVDSCRVTRTLDTLPSSNYLRHILTPASSTAPWIPAFLQARMLPHRWVSRWVQVGVLYVCAALARYAAPFIVRLPLCRIAVLCRAATAHDPSARACVGLGEVPALDVTQGITSIIKLRIVHSTTFSRRQMSNITTSIPSGGIQECMHKDSIPSDPQELIQRPDSHAEQHRPSATVSPYLTEALRPLRSPVASGRDRSCGGRISPATVGARTRRFKPSEKLATYSRLYTSIFRYICVFLCICESIRE
ncbi:hypothetical protein C8Q80DRAFT_864796 [Daedaleopsis nitida]|nr:hypothetical protein C8Q80DRAFT_864796 [Daedaleopsis nitida]